MAERTNARLLKSRETQVSVGSNPTPSAQGGPIALFQTSKVEAQLQPAAQSRNDSGDSLELLRSDVALLGSVRVVLDL